MGRPAGILALTTLQIFLAALAIPNGILLIADPSGKVLGLDMILSYLPFISDFLLVGIWLLVGFGIFPVSLAYGLWNSKIWAWAGSLALALMEILWMSVQVAVLYKIGFNVWQVIIPSTAILSVGILYLPSVRNFFKVSSIKGSIEIYR